MSSDLRTALLAPDTRTHTHVPHGCRFEAILCGALLEVFWEARAGCFSDFNFVSRPVLFYWLRQGRPSIFQ